MCVVVIVIVCLFCNYTSSNSSNAVRMRQDSRVPSPKSQQLSEPRPWLLICSLISGAEWQRIRGAHL